ncbi:PIG-L deacetylase family protein [Luteimonas sp. A611]
MAAVAPPRINGAGQCESAWRASPWLAALDERPAAQLLQGRCRLVLLSPHPDDETLACGGLLRAASQAGLDILLVAVTDGEACYPGDAAWTPDRLREVRPREVTQALDVLDVRAQVQRLGIPDGGVEARSAALKATLRTLLQPGDLVLAPWEQDGHPDHDAVGRAALAAAAQPGMRLLRYPVWAWHWLLPHTRRPPFDALRMPLTPETVVLKQRAIACFASQLQSDAPHAPAPILPAHVVQRFHRPFEVYLP